VPLSRDTAALLQAALGQVEQSETGPLPDVSEFFKSVVPSNVVAAANNGDILPLTVFSVMFSLALTRIASDRRRAIVTFFDAIGARFATSDAHLLPLDGHSRRSRRRDAADRGGPVPRDGSSDECRRGLLCSSLAEPHAQRRADDRRDCGRGGNELQRGEPSRR